MTKDARMLARELLKHRPTPDTLPDIIQARAHQYQLDCKAVAHVMVAPIDTAEFLKLCGVPS